MRKINLFIFGLLWLLTLTGCGSETEEKSETGETTVLSPTGILATVNELSAIAQLKALHNAQYIWRRVNIDNNEAPDYWTYDVSCLHRMYQNDGRTKGDFISYNFALADAQPAAEDAFGKGRIAPLGSTTPKNGYLFRAMLTDENNKAYNQIEVNGVKAANLHRFGFVAFPNRYGTTGKRTFITNQNGRVYGLDTGSDEHKIVLDWPSPDPIAKGWHQAGE